MLSLRAYEMYWKPYAPVVLPTSEPAFVILAGMMRAWFHMVPEAAEHVTVWPLNDKEQQIIGKLG